MTDDDDDYRGPPRWIPWILLLSVLISGAVAMSIVYWL